MKHTTRIAIRFADIDSMGHVNNATYLTYFEQARIDFFNTLIGKWDWKKNGVVLARNEVDYISPIFMQDEVQIETTVERIGSKSMTLSYQVFKSVQGSCHLFAKGSSVIVSYDYKRGVTTEISDEWREAFTQESKE